MNKEAERSGNSENDRKIEETNFFSFFSGPAIVALVFGAVLYLLILALFRRKKNDESKNDDLEPSNVDSNGKKLTFGKGKSRISEDPKAATATAKDSQRRTQATQNVKGKVKDTYTHPSLVTSLRGHVGEICDVDFSANGKYLVTSSEDRSVFIWTCADFLTDNPAKEIRHSKLNVDFDHAGLVRFSPDSKALLGRMDNANVVRVFKLNKKADGNFGSLQAALDLPTSPHGDILFLDINCNGKYIMTGYASTHVCLWSLKGQLLATLITNVATLYCSKVSPCGRFIAASGFTPDVKVWEANFDKITGDFHSVERAFELKGHSAAIPAFAFSGDSTHMVSVSKDKTFRLYDINVEYKKKQDARLVQTATWTKEDVDVSKTQVALSNDSRCVVIASKTDILILSGVDGSVKNVIQSPLSVAIQKLVLDPSSGFIVVIGGRTVRVFRNTVGFEITIDALNDKLKYATQDSIRQRLQQQLEDAQKALLAIKSHISS